MINSDLVGWISSVHHLYANDSTSLDQRVLIAHARAHLQHVREYHIQIGALLAWRFEVSTGGTMWSELLLRHSP